MVQKIFGMGINTHFNNLHLKNINNKKSIYKKYIDNLYNF